MRVERSKRANCERLGHMVAGTGELREARSMDGCRLGRVVVIKLGGSVLTDDESYRNAARFLVHRLHKCSEERLVVVVSARKGFTDELERLARRITGYPNPR